MKSIKALAIIFLMSCSFAQSAQAGVVQDRVNQVVKASSRFCVLAHLTMSCDGRAGLEIMRVARGDPYNVMYRSGISAMMITNGFRVVNCTDEACFYSK